MFNQNFSKALNYRADIDGLRALAVLSVVIYHFFPKILRGGFIGVDIFFVISGFLIARIIFTHLNENRFSFLSFYSHRIRRIFPALILVLFSTFIFGKIIFFDDEFLNLSKHIFAGSAFFSNFLLWNESGYFDTASEFKPLLHLWSLGIEGQFYIVFPFLLYFAHQKHFRLITLIVILFVFSFFLNRYFIFKNPTGTFYAPWCRMWELLSGAILAYFLLGGGKSSLKSTTDNNFCCFLGLKNKNENNTEKENEKENKNFIFNFLDFYLSKILFTNPRKAGQTLPNFLSFFGFLLLIFGFFRIREGLPYPGYWALVPTTGAILIILAGEKAYLNCKILKNTMAIFLGRISYPLYLWHWPLLVYLKIYYGEKPHDWILILCLLFSILLAYGTTILIENPLRFGKFNRLKVFGLSLVMGILGAWGAWFFYTSLDKEAHYGWLEEYVGPKKWSNWVYLGNRQAPYNLVLFGDSHAHQYMRGILDAFGKDYSIDILSGPCNAGKTQLSLNPFFDKDFFKQYCLPMQQNLMQNKTPDVVINGNFLRLYDNMPKTKEEFKRQIEDKIALFNPPPKLMIFVGDAGEIHSVCETTNVRKLKHKTKVCPKPSQESHLNFKKWSMENTFPPFVRFVYPYDFYCNADGACQVYAQNGKANYLDQDHFTYQGTLPIVAKIKEMVTEHLEKNKKR